MPQMKWKSKDSVVCLILYWGGKDNLQWLPWLNVSFMYVGMVFVYLFVYLLSVIPNIAGLSSVNNWNKTQEGGFYKRGLLRLKCIVKTVNNYQWTAVLGEGGLRYLKYFLREVIYLFKRFTHREERTDRSSLPWLAPHMSAMVWSGPGWGWGWELGGSVGSPIWVRSPSSWASPCCFPRCLQRAGSEMEQPVLVALVPIWNAGGAITVHTEVLASQEVLSILKRSC